MGMHLQGLRARRSWAISNFFGFLGNAKRNASCDDSIDRRMHTTQKNGRTSLGAKPHRLETAKHTTDIKLRASRCKGVRFLMYANGKPSHFGQTRLESSGICNQHLQSGMPELPKACHIYLNKSNPGLQFLTQSGAFTTSHDCVGIFVRLAMFASCLAEYAMQGSRSNSSVNSISS